MDEQRLKQEITNKVLDWLIDCTDDSMANDLSPEALTKMFGDAPMSDDDVGENTISDEELNELMPEPEHMPMEEMKKVKDDEDEEDE